MTSVATIDSRAGRARRGALRGLASFLAFLCLVLFLLAIEQKHAVAAWEALTVARDAVVSLMTAFAASEIARA